MNLQVSDLFKKIGKNFVWEERYKEQEELVKRLREQNDEQLTKIAEEIDDFAQTSICSIVFLEYMLERITKVCSEKNIAMS